jgi:hypothetical protein
MSLQDRIGQRLAIASKDCGVFAQWYLQDMTELLGHVSTIGKLLISALKVAENLPSPPQDSANHPPAHKPQESGKDQ